ncbi:benzoate 4-monooxygenase cytochrome P450 [Apiospora marii]|uniref:Benzoate 4-monooxygenase cytochrome P450 n=1 Tax=Apiospora marii TaxID=335849 RepID=A0ABR1SSV5_9PEZI
MLNLPQDGSYALHWAPAVALLSLALIVGRLIYNLYLHPLSHIPGPFWARASGVPNWLHARSGKRHIWLWRQFERHGNRIRVTPGTVLFRDPAAYPEIYGTKANVRRSHFYTAFKRAKGEDNTLNSIDVAEHAYRRRVLQTCFTERSVRAASGFIVKHVDRWNEILALSTEENDSSRDSEKGWSAPIDMSESIDTLVFDIMGDLAFGRSFDIKEPGGDNPLKVIPHTIAQYMQFYYPLCRSPFLHLLIWLKPRGLDRLFLMITPPAVLQYNDFVYKSVSNRTKLHREQAEKPEGHPKDQRMDMFHFLCEARDPDTGRIAYDENNLRAESSLLIVAGSDTTSTALSGIFFYLTGDPPRLAKLTAEIRTTFDSADDIVHGPKLLGCRYLAACIDEGMRLAPPGPSELPREVLPGGLTVRGEYYPPGTIVGTVPWADSRNEAVYDGDATVFRPERWIVDEESGVTADSVARRRANFHPFTTGPLNCVGKNLAMTEIMITVARTLHRLDIRRAPGSTMGGGRAEFGWGATDEKQLQLVDAYIALRRGPEVQFRRRAS